MSAPKIVGISLVRNEDVFIEQALRNVLDFCDELIVLDQRSNDRTPRILARLAAEEPKLRLHSIPHPSLSHDFVSPYAGEPVWVLNVDGDEIYDPVRLASFRPRVLEGEFDDWWLVRCSTLHCVAVDRESGTATGYLSPPARAMPKLYNFRSLESWEGPTPERLHEGNRRFRPGYSQELRRDLARELGWEGSPFRMLHACFVRRSSRQPPWLRVRENPLELYYAESRSARLRRNVKALLGRPTLGKRLSYERGELVTVDVRDFFPA